jgi:hypothetical protein
MDRKNPGNHSPAAGLLLVGLVAAMTGCYHTRLTAAGKALTTTGLPAVLNSSRVLPPVPLPPPPGDCSANGLYQVQVETTYGQALHTVFTFGSWSQVEARYWCAAPPPSGIPALPSMPPPASPTTATGSSAPILGTTMNAMFWGALQDNLNENVASTKNNRPDVRAKPCASSSFRGTIGMR